MSRGLPKKVANLLEKAKESALLAVDIYNKPKTAFRSGGFIVLMCIAWTSLLHAVFERQGVKYYRKKGKRRYEVVDGDYRTWELTECAKYFYHYPNNPVFKNIDFFVTLRNKIEHRFMPIIDPSISGECQALLLNFEELIVKEFGDVHSIVESLFIPLQFTTQRKSLPRTKQDEKVFSFIKQFRDSLTEDVANSQQYAFKAFFIPKIGNHRNSSDVAIEFVRFDPADPAEMAQYEKMIVGIKEKVVSVVNPGHYKPSTVLAMINSKAKIDKGMGWHTQMWKKYQVRPPTQCKNPRDCKVEFCQYDEPHKDYIYTDNWVAMLIEKELQSL